MALRRRAPEHVSILAFDSLDFANATGGAWYPADGHPTGPSSRSSLTWLRPALAPRNKEHRRGQTRWLRAEGRREGGLQPRLVTRRRSASPSTAKSTPRSTSTDRPCTCADLGRSNADGTNERRLDPLVEGCAPAPEWSPDGTRLAGVLIVPTPDDPKLGFHYGVMTVDGDDPQVALLDGGAGSWQPVVAPIPPAPSFGVSSPAP